MDNMTDAEQSNTQSSAILKELSDMGKVLAVMTNQIKNIETTQQESKADIKEIKNDFVSRREFNETVKALKDEINSLKKWRDTIVYAIVLAVVAAVLKLVIK